MKKLMSLLLVLTLCLSLTACADKNAVTYYYVRREDEYLYGTADGVMVGEAREAAGHADDLRYLLTLYFHGPVSENLKSPFPIGTQLVELAQEEDCLNIRLTSMFSVLEGADLTLACACLARTCFDLTDAQTVSIMAMGRETVSMTIERDSLLLVDDSFLQLNQESE